MKINYFINFNITITIIKSLTRLLSESMQSTDDSESQPITGASTRRRYACIQLLCPDEMARSIFLLALILPFFILSMLVFENLKDIDNLPVIIFAFWMYIHTILSYLILYIAARSYQDTRCWFIINICIWLIWLAGIIYGAICVSIVYNIPWDYADQFTMVYIFNYFFQLHPIIAYIFSSIRWVEKTDDVLGDYEFCRFICMR